LIYNVCFQLFFVAFVTVSIDFFTISPITTVMATALAFLLFVWQEEDLVEPVSTAAKTRSQSSFILFVVLVVNEFCSILCPQLL
jgi:hypothetical protein